MVDSLVVEDPIRAREEVLAHAASPRASTSSEITSARNGRHECAERAGSGGRAWWDVGASKPQAGVPRWSGSDFVGSRKPCHPPPRKWCQLSVLARELAAGGLCPSQAGRWCCSAPLRTPGRDGSQPRAKRVVSLDSVRRQVEERAQGEPMSTSRVVARTTGGEVVGRRAPRGAAVRRGAVRRPPRWGRCGSGRRSRSSPGWGPARRGRVRAGVVAGRRARWRRCSGRPSSTSTRTASA